MNGNRVHRIGAFGRACLSWALAGLTALPAMAAAKTKVVKDKTPLPTPVAGFNPARGRFGIKAELGFPFFVFELSSISRKDCAAFIPAEPQPIIT